MTNIKFDWICLVYWDYQVKGNKSSKQLISLCFYKWQSCYLIAHHCGGLWSCPYFTGESIPIRLFLSPYELTPTYRNINNKFSVKYYLNLVLVDEEDRRYFKQQEITIYRLQEETSWLLILHGIRFGSQLKGKKTINCLTKPCKAFLVFILIVRETCFYKGLGWLGTLAEWELSYDVVANYVHGPCWGGEDMWSLLWHCNLKSAIVAYYCSKVLCFVWTI